MRYFSLLLVCFFFWFAHNSEAQEWDSKEIATFESNRFVLPDSKSSTSDVGQAYDWIFAHCQWNIDPWQRFISGEVSHHIELLQTTDSIDFDLSNEMVISLVEVNGEAVTDYGFSSENAFYVKSASFATGGFHTVNITYSGEPKPNNFLSFNQGFHGNSIPEIWTLSEPFGSADWWPSKMSLDDKLDSVRIEITVPNGNKAASQGTLESVVDNADFTSTYTWMHRYPIPAYLVSMAVTNYAEFSYFAELENSTVEILNYVYPERLEDELERGAEIVSMMELFSQLFGEYPYAQEKYGHAQASIPGGMEHSTMSTMSGLSYNLSAHELAHQWFGNKVTCGSWEDIWLNEGFATYANGLAIEFLKPDEFDEWKASRISSVTSQPGGSVVVSDTLDRSRIFDGRLSYNKGAYLLHMLRWVIGDDVFFEGCRNYLAHPDHSFAYAHTEELIQIMEEVSGRDLTNFFADWYYGEGYPIYSAAYSVNAEGVILRIHQTQSHPSVDFFEMPIAIRVVGEDADTTVVLDNEVQDQTYFIKTEFLVSTLEFDPESWILSKSEILLDQSLGGEEDLTVLAYPNPASTEVRFFSSAPAVTIDFLELYDVEGKLFRRSEIPGGQLNGFRMSVDKLDAGIYVVRFGDLSDYSLKILISD